MKSNFIKSTIILVIGGAITKVMAMIIKIFLTRSIGDEGIGLYMLVMPTFTLFITLCSLSLSTSISKLIASKINSKKVVLPLIPISLIYNFILMIILMIIAPFIANTLLNNSLTYYPIMGIGFTLPFICISGILKGYFYGKENMIPFVISNIIEQVVRLLFIILVIPKLIKYGISIAVLGVVLINIFSEFASIICLILFLPKKKFEFKNFKIEKNIFKDILNISLSATGSRLIGSISYFLEPIILTFILLKVGYTSQNIAWEYGIITGYVFPLLLIPSFFTMAISTSLLPVISSGCANRNYNYTKNKLKQAIIMSLSIGIGATIIFMIFPKELLHFIYNTNLGVNYVRILAPLFLIHYVQAPLTSYLQAVNMAKEAMMGTLVGAFIKNILLIILPIYIGMWGFIIATVVNIFYVTLQHIYYIRKSFVR